MLYLFYSIVLYCIISYYNYSPGYRMAHPGTVETCMSVPRFRPCSPNLLVIYNAPKTETLNLPGSLCCPGRLGIPAQLPCPWASGRLQRILPAEPVAGRDAAALQACEEMPQLQRSYSFLADLQALTGSRCECMAPPFQAPQICASAVRCSRTRCRDRMSCCK